MSDSIVWAAPCGSWGNCDSSDLIVIRKADLFHEEWDAIINDDTNDPYTIISMAFDRIQYGEIEA